MLLKRMLRWREYSKKVVRILRYLRWNRQKGITISRNAIVAGSVHLQLAPNETYFGGEITVHHGARISEGVVLTPWGGHITIETNVFIGPYCVLYGQGGLSIGKNAMIGGHTFIVAANHGYAVCNTPMMYQPESKKGVVIGEDVWIGCNVSILDGVQIGKGCVIGAGAVVTKSVPDYAIAVGVPAKVVSKRGEAATSTSASVIGI